MQMTADGGAPDRDVLVAMERLAVRAWPATETADVDGWLWRWSGGGSQRANSVSTVDFHGSDADAAVGEVEGLYRAKGQVPRFQLYDESRPTGLAALLSRRGYETSERCTTLWKPAPRAVALPAEARISDTPDEGWLEVYLGAQSLSRQTVNRAIVARVPAPRAFVSCVRQGRVLATGLCVVHGRLAIIECMATRDEARRQGAARVVLAAIETWAAGHGARHLFLQAVEDNVAAQALYRGFGMTLAGHYSFMTLAE